jgi:hypothetical protein
LLPYEDGQCFVNLGQTFGRSRQFSLVANNVDRGRLQVKASVDAAQSEVTDEI